MAFPCSFDSEIVPPIPTLRYSLLFYFQSRPSKPLLRYTLFFLHSIERYAYSLGAALNTDLTQQLPVFAHIVRHPLVGSAAQDIPAFFWLGSTVNSVYNISFRE